MVQNTLTLRLETADETDTLGRNLSRIARAGDCFLLRGQIGAGKSALARAFIRARLGAETDVPSPTFTLIQTYDCDDVEIWHADLYRLSDPQEAIELGLTDAFEQSICLIEWPELLDDLTPPTAVNIQLHVTPDAHVAVLTFDATWRDRIGKVFDDT